MNKQIDQQSSCFCKMKVTPTKLLLSLACFVLLFVLVNSHEEEEEEEIINRSQFSNGFIFGAATSSYQVEGAAFEDGRGLSTWDPFTHTQGNIADGLTADVADDHYHLYHEDIEIMHSLGLNSYRFSLSWSRILPRGRFGDVNLDGIMFYNKLIDSLLLKGIEPFVTIFHFDIPQELEDRYQSWLSPLIQEDFVYYADICFRYFGDRVKNWVTINEPNLLVHHAYTIGVFPPNRCSAPLGNCSSGNSEVEPVIVNHNLILSHAKAAELYRKHYQAKQGGSIGVALNAATYLPYSDDEADHEAANRAMVFNNAWFLDPLIHGDYPAEIKQYLGAQLPEFSKEESNRLKDGLLDFIGVNHYITLYAKDCIKSPCDSDGNSAILGYMYSTGEKNGVPIGEPTPFPRFFVVPDGLEKIIGYFKTRYNNITMFVTENGICQWDEPLKPWSEMLNDFKRVEYHKKYLAALSKAIRDGADVRGYFVWSLMDNFEWLYGYTLRFGLYYVDYHTLERTPKLSGKWYKSFLKNGTGADQRRITGVTPKNQYVIHE